MCTYFSNTISNFQFIFQSEYFQFTKENIYQLKTFVRLENNKAKRMYPSDIQGMYYQQFQP